MTRLLAAVLGIPLLLSADPLSQHVTITRDTYGVPHIKADSEEAAAFAMGWAQAEDHCVEVAKRLVAARGEQSKYLGGNRENDFFARRYRIWSISKETLPKLSPVLQAMMQAYADGFNLYVEKHRAALPSWIPKFDAVDVVAQGRAQITRFTFPKAVIDAIQKKYPPSGGAPVAQVALRGGSTLGVQYVGHCAVEVEVG